MQYFGKFSRWTRCTCITDTHFSWKGYLIESLTPKINIRLIAYKKKQAVRRCLPSKILLSLSIYSFNMNILENIPHALDVHAQRVLKYNFILIYDFTIIETGRFNVFL
jgi:hypothetical protein